MKFLFLPFALVFIFASASFAEPEDGITLLVYVTNFEWFVLPERGPTEFKHAIEALWIRNVGDLRPVYFDQRSYLAAPQLHQALLHQVTRAVDSADKITSIVFMTDITEKPRHLEINGVGTFYQNDFVGYLRQFFDKIGPLFSDHLHLYLGGQMSAKTPDTEILQNLWTIAEGLKPFGVRELSVFRTTELALPVPVSHYPRSSAIMKRMLQTFIYMTGGMSVMGVFGLVCNLTDFDHPAAITWEGIRTGVSALAGLEALTLLTQFINLSKKLPTQEANGIVTRIHGNGEVSETEAENWSSQALFGDDRVPKCKVH